MVPRYTLRGLQPAYCRRRCDVARRPGLFVELFEVAHGFLGVEQCTLPRRQYRMAQGIAPGRIMAEVDGEPAIGAPVDSGQSGTAGRLPHAARKGGGGGEGVSVR